MHTPSRHSGGVLVFFAIVADAGPFLQRAKVAEDGGVATSCAAMEASYKAQEGCTGVCRTVATVENLGVVHAVCDRTGNEPKVYLELNFSDWMALTPSSEFEDFTINVPEGCPPFNHVFVALASPGHPPWDMRGFLPGERDGGYGRTHVDIHFIVVTQEEREAMTVCTPLASNPIQCDLSADDDATMKFQNLPDPAYTTGFFEDPNFGGHSIIGHGTHLFPDTDADIVRCNSTGPNGNWEDCQNQYISAYPDSMNTCGYAGCAIQDFNCTCGYWHDGVSPILNVIDGMVLGNEIMPTLDHASMLGTELANPYLDPYPQAEKYQSSGYQPQATISNRTADGKLQFGLLLSSECSTADS
mmetsp:Transcript_101333/g.285793  ORF Transcript_101333/g.285793 Transcript_101333/m.285793 type:complete len:357 (-) Transcript_101333:165-1235(-)|eukprot:CAMPEP_0117492176 /NCGR_PEP_ID=MMETSP0784-20121206/18446_1 /TAXON_ID=39447 /ORGANISM="" /LENGTH=356 /DNA_ID=CAMNT_0005286987 /DNA_START=66 /DNA_END=1136 /DNA_ORIENTATION=+